jgi:two-component system chemotaxis response regulator CheB
MKSKRITPMRVIVVDDSAFSRQTIKMILEKSRDIDVIGVAYDGQDAIKKILRLKPDALTLDLEMPTMDGYTLLRWLMKEHPLPVIVISSHKHDSTVFKALELGAVDFVVKPTSRASHILETIEEDLLRKLSSLNLLRMEKIKKNLALLDRMDKIQKVGPSIPDRIEIIAIGASTGGPTAIQSILSILPSDFPCPIVISQHMPGGFTKQFADRLNRISRLNVSESEEYESLEMGKILICPGDSHMTFTKLGGKIVVQLKKPTSKDKYTPSIDIMMRSAAQYYGDTVMGVILTGMGNDGTSGMTEIKRRGGFTIAESEESSVVYGMSREVIEAGAADSILPLEDIPYEIMRSLNI